MGFNGFRETTDPKVVPPPPIVKYSICISMRWATWESEVLCSCLMAESCSVAAFSVSLSLVTTEAEFRDSRSEHRLDVSGYSL